MGRDFKYKDFVNKLRFQVGGVCPEEFGEYGEKYIKNSIYSHSLKAAKALYESPAISSEACEVITQIIAEWTFHKTIDLINGDIPDVFHERVLNQINQAIFDYLIDENNQSPITFDNTSETVTVVELIVQDTYRDALSRVYSDKGISKDVYKWAVSQSHIDDMASEISENSGVKEDKFTLHTPQISFREVFMHEKFLFCAYFVSIIINLFALISSAKADSNFVFVFAGFLILLITGLCRRIFLAISKIAFDNTQELEEQIDDLQNAANPNCMYERLGVDVISMQVGLGLVPLCDPDGKNKLMPAIAKLRKTMTDDLGYIIPNIRVMDSSKLKSNECIISIRNVMRDNFVVDTKAFDCVDVIIEHIHNCCIKHVNDIFSKTDVLKLIELVRSQDPTLTNDLIPELISAIDFRRIMVNLIREKVPVKDIILIFERLCDFARFNKEPYVLSERLRTEMGAQICLGNSVNVNGVGVLYVLTFSTESEQALENAVQNTELGQMLRLAPEQIEALIEAVTKTLDNLGDLRENIVLLVSPKVRFALYGLLSRYFDVIKIMSFSELITEIKVEQVGEINF